MPTPAEEAFRAELIAERDEINHLEGLKKYGVIPQDNAGTAAEIVARQEAIRSRVEVINRVLEGMDALDANGYPGLPPRDLRPEIYDDLKDDIQDLRAALTGFRRLRPATSLSGTLGMPAPEEG